MKIGFSVEGSTDRALLKGLQMRWCPEASLIEGKFRGSTRESLRREYGKICAEFVERDVDAMVFLRDANEQPWRDVQRQERLKFPQERLGRAIHGVADRNVECWICAEPEWLARELRTDAVRFRCEDPKKALERALEIDRDDRKESEIAELVSKAPLARWLANRSFKDFYDQIRDQSQQLGCSIEDLS
jgi:hypothetical protein